MGIIVVTRDADGTTHCCSEAEHDKTQAKQWTPDWENPDTIDGLNMVLDRPKSAGTRKVARDRKTLSPAEIWPQLTDADRRAVMRHVNDQNRLRAWQAECEEQDDEIEAMDKASVKAQKLRVPTYVVIEEHVLKFRTGMKSERVEVHSGLMQQMLAEVGFEVTREDLMVGLDVDDTRVFGGWDAYTPEEAAAKAEAEWNENPNAKRAYKTRERHAAEQWYVRSARYFDEVVWKRSGKKYPNEQTTFIAPANLTPAQVGVYEALRSDGLTPAEAETAARAIAG